MPVRIADFQDLNPVSQRPACLPGSSAANPVRRRQDRQTWGHLPVCFMTQAIDLKRFIELTFRLLPVLNAIPSPNRDVVADQPHTGSRLYTDGTFILWTCASRWTGRPMRGDRTDRAGVPEISVASAAPFLGALWLGRGLDRHRDGGPIARFARHRTVPPLPAGALHHCNRVWSRSRLSWLGEFCRLCCLSLHPGQPRGAPQHEPDHGAGRVHADQYGHGAGLCRATPRSHRERAVFRDAERSERVFEAQPNDARRRDAGGGSRQGGG